MTTVGTRAVVSKGKVENVLKKAKWVWRPKMNYQDHVYKYNGSYMLKKFEYGNPEILLQDHAVVDSGCSSHMTGNKAYLSDYEDLNRGFVAFGSDPKGALSFLNGNHVVLRAPRKDDMYSLDLKNIVPSGGQGFHGVKDVFRMPHKAQLLKCFSKQRDIQDTEDVFDKEGNNRCQKLTTFVKKKSGELHLKKKAAPQATQYQQLVSDRPFVSTDRSFVSTDRSNTPNVSAASTSTGANADESSFVYLGGKIPIDASTLPNADLPIDPNMSDLEDASDTLPNDGILMMMKM
ncbi:hypothetical protein Tco_0058586 [Tanacetum coccineum]